MLKTSLPGSMELILDHEQQTFICLSTGVSNYSIAKGLGTKKVHFWLKFKGVIILK